MLKSTNTFINIEFMNVAIPCFLKYENNKFHSLIVLEAQLLSNYQKISFPLIIRRSASLKLHRCHRLAPSHRHSRNIQLFRPYIRCLLVDLDVLYGFATQNLIRKPCIMVRGVKKLSFCSPVDLVYFLNYRLLYTRSLVLD